MKKLIKLLALSVAFAFVFTACGSKQALDETSAKQLAEKHTQLMLDGDYETVLADCSEAVKKQVDAAALESGWNQVTAVTGAVKSVRSSEYRQQGKYATVQVTLECENMGMVINFAYSAEGVIEGLNLNMTTIETETQLADTDLYYEEEITVGEYSLKGIVTLPKNTENYPVAILVQGSGASDYDETVGKNKPFMEIAHALAEKGIASVRINKRFFQLPELAAQQMDTLTVYDEYMDDIYAAIDYAKQNVGEKIFVVGHSQGGMSAPKIALDNDLDGIIMLAGTTRGLEDIMYDQNVAVVEKANLSDREKSETLKQVADGVQQAKSVKEGDKTSPLGVPATYWLSLKDLDAENILKNTDKPVLILQGTEDFQVFYDKDYQHMQSVLAGNTNITFKEYEGLNHMFMPQTQPGVTDITEYMAENHIPQYVLDDITQFILDNN